MNRPVVLRSTDGGKQTAALIWQPALEMAHNL